MTETAVPDVISRLKAMNGQYGEVSKRSGLSHSYITKLANGARGVRMSVATLDKLNGALNDIAGEDLASA